MSILIKGMKTPTSCDDCWFEYAYEFCESQYENCPLVKLPPHGRLIDADELFKEMERKGWFNNADRDKAEDLVLDAPTIIPAEEDE